MMFGSTRSWAFDLDAAGARVADEVWNGQVAVDSQPLSWKRLRVRARHEVEVTIIAVVYERVLCCIG